MVERREFLIGCGAAFVAAGLGSVAIMGATSKERFRALLNSRFYIRDQARTGVTIELIRVTDGPTSPELEQFSLRFRGPRAPHFSSGLYQVRHAQAGSFQLYIEPVREDTTGSYYAADFSLLRGTAKHPRKVA